MKKNLWEALKYENEKKEWKLDIEDQRYLDLVLKCLYPHNMARMEIEQIRRDLIGMAEEGRLQGESLEKRLGASAEDFAETIIQNGGSQIRREKFFFFLWRFWRNMLPGICGILIVLMISAMSMREPELFLQVELWIYPFLLLIGLILCVGDVYIQERFRKNRLMNIVVSIAEMPLGMLLGGYLRSNSKGIDIFRSQVSVFWFLPFCGVLLLISWLGKRGFEKGIERQGGEVHEKKSLGSFKI